MRALMLLCEVIDHSGGKASTRHTLAYARLLSIMLLHLRAPTATRWLCYCMYVHVYMCTHLSIVPIWYQSGIRIGINLESDTGYMY